MTIFSVIIQGLIKLLYNGRGDRIRTCDPLFPKQMRYQAAPLPDAVAPRLAQRRLQGKLVGPEGFEPPTKPL